MLIHNFHDGLPKQRCLGCIKCYVTTKADTLSPKKFSIRHVKMIKYARNGVHMANRLTCAQACAHQLQRLRLC